MKIAVIGSGLSGLSFAKTLESNAGIDLFDKSRGYGGRMATRRDAEYQFDHGAQYFTVKADEFRSFLQPYLDNEIVKPWEANYVELDRETITSSQTWTAESGHYVGSPNMSSLCREIASDHNVNLNTEIMKIDRRDGKWVLIDKNNNSVSGYDWVVFAVTPQHIENIMHYEFEDKPWLTGQKLFACFSLMLGYKKTQNVTWDAARVVNSDIGWVSINSSKPDRQGNFSIIAQSTNTWAEKNIEMDINHVQQHLVNELDAIMPIDVRNYDFVKVHRWRYANISRQHHGRDYYLNTVLKLASVGDWYINARVESAFLSGHRAAIKLKELL